jgi:nitrate/nitrite-specific signal transduction histidine kinase
VIGGLHTDFPITYVMEAQNQLRMRLLPGMVVSYLILLAIVVALSTSLTRPLKRLTSATQRVAEGEYDLDVTSLAPRWLPDEIWTLASSITAMAGKVAARERSFVTEVKRLRVEVDKAKRAASVTEITQSDFFTDLAAKAEMMRRRMRD